MLFRMVISRWTGQDRVIGRLFFSSLHCIVACPSGYKCNRCVSDKAAPTRFQWGHGDHPVGSSTPQASALALNLQRLLHQTAMVSDGAPHRVFKISELSSAIASQLIPISRGSTVNLARTCRYLEEPVLGALWGEQPWVVILLKVLPGGLDRKYIMSKNGWEVCGRDVSLEAPNAQVRSF